VTLAESLEEMVIEEMLADCMDGTAHEHYPRWERAWAMCAGLYKQEGDFFRAKKCEDNIVTLRAMRRSDGLAELAS
jgi:hypothetical protein